LQLEDLAPDGHRDLLGQVPVGHRGGDRGDVAHLGGEVGGHVVDAVGQVLPRAGDRKSGGQGTELAFGAHLPGHPGDLVGERRELVDHGVDRPLEFQDLALDVDGDLLGQVTPGDGGGDGGDVADLGGEVGGHEVDAVGQVLPRA